jgi:hypothetical protein
VVVNAMRESGAHAGTSGAQLPGHHTLPRSHGRAMTGSVRRLRGWKGGIWFAATEPGSAPMGREGIWPTF